MAERAGEKSSPKMMEIVRTGDGLFSRFGLRRVTVEEICREAGVSKVTFYKYFRGKLDLFKYIWTGWSDRIYDRLVAMEESGASFTERMNAIVEFKMELVSRMNPVFIEDLIHTGTELEAFFTELRAKSMKRFLAFVSDAQLKGEMRSVRPEFLISVLDLLGELLKKDELRRLYPDDAAFIREINDFFFFGIVPAGERGKERS